MKRAGSWKIKGLIFSLIFLAYACNEGKKNQVSVVTIVDTTESSIPPIKFDKQKKQHLESKLIEAGVNKRLLDSLMTIDFSAFIGKPLGTLLDRIGNPKGYFFSGDPSGELGSCYLEYEDSIILRVAPKELQYLKHYNSNNQWNMDTLRFEKIRYISIIKGEEVYLYVDQ